MKQKSLYIAIVLALHCAVAVADNSIDSTQIDEVTVNGDGNNISGLRKVRISGEILLG
ncbi:hypothetical protein PEY55_17180 [Citrobacter portucalensis]|uniref:Autotransporter outer membrane beta-barrel domain-containing protein n=1 Tax=Citrobacter portucalensis TaxID=1639133 RepID=A0AAW7LVA5_9ENTR|nr:hypothetical protein [Citrobacter portucalensis]MDN4370005.1 hypothetical protein [Citrobacter portucalensis]